MTPFRSFSLTTLAAAALTALGACSSLPPGNPTLEMARAENRTAQATAQTQTLAPLELSQAAEAMARAEAALVQREDADRVTQLAYLARQRVALAQETAARKASEAAVVEAGARRDQLRLEARTREADDATRRAGQATQAANSAQQQAASAQRDANLSQQQADAARQIAAASQMQAGATESRNQALEAQLRELNALNARQTDRGMVVTLGDVLFDTGLAQLSPGGLRSVERLGAFLVAYPQRQALIEGYTDSVGSDQQQPEPVRAPRRCGADRLAGTRRGPHPAHGPGLWRDLPGGWQHRRGRSADEPPR